MISTVWSRVDTTLIYPPLFDRLQAMLEQLHSQGAVYFAVSGFRSYQAQEALWSQGRSTPGQRVTNAHAGESPHCFGIAVDFVRDGHIETPGLQPDYRPALYAELGVAAKLCGLAWGGDFANLPDMPHVQLARYVTADQLTPLRQAYESGGLVSVFKYLDANP